MGFFFFCCCFDPPLRPPAHGCSRADDEQTFPRVSNVALLFPVQTVRPGSELEGVIEFFLDPGWHVYWKNPGDIGTAPFRLGELLPGITLKEVSWPAPSRFKTGEAFFYGYKGTPKWVVRLAIDPGMPGGAVPHRALRLFGSYATEPASPLRRSLKLR